MQDIDLNFSHGFPCEHSNEFSSDYLQFQKLAKFKCDNPSPQKLSQLPVLVAH